ncbi:MAG: hypothetical protein ABI616_11540 [Pseudomonadota bacterium]
MLSLPEKLRPDCGNCCGLCCVVPPFDAEQGFGHDKLARQPCHHLQADFRCGIYGHLEEKGYPGCVAFDCFGAGQRVTQELFGGVNWSQSPEIATEIFDSYERLRPLHELMAMAQLAIGKTNDEAQLQALHKLISEIDALCTRDARPNLAQLRRETIATLRSALAANVT